jgi:hypothetical protein
VNCSRVMVVYSFACVTGATFRETDLSGVNEVPALVLVIVVSVEALFAQEAEIVRAYMRL